MDLMTGKKTRRGAAAITLHDVAKAAGVSPMTVSRVIRGETSVNQEMREQVEATIARTGYSPNPAARGLASGGVTRVGILYGNPSASFTSDMLVGLLEGGSRLGCQLILKRCDDPVHACDHARALVQAKVQGVILSAPLCDNQNLATYFAEVRVPSLALGAASDNGHPLSLLINNQAAAGDLTRYLIKMGHRDIGFVRGHVSQLDSEQRLQGFLSALQDAGLPLRADRITQGDYSFRSGMEAGDRLLSRSDRPTAIFASNDEMAAGVLAAAYRLRLDVPTELSVVGFDDSAIAATSWPGLTTMRQPIAEMGAQALEMMIGELRGRGKRRKLAQRSLTLQLKLVERESVSARQ